MTWVDTVQEYSGNSNTISPPGMRGPIFDVECPKCGGDAIEYGWRHGGVTYFDGNGEIKITDHYIKCTDKSCLWFRPLSQEDIDSVGVHKWTETKTVEHSQMNVEELMEVATDD